jgi:hypothetical protein
MDILVTCTGRIFRRVDDCTALLLMEALPESFKRVDPKQHTASAPVQTTPHFYVAPSSHTGVIGLYVQLPTGEIRSIFGEMTREKAAAALGAGEIPQHIFEAYIARRKSNSPDPALADLAASQVAGNRWRR